MSAIHVFARALALASILPLAATQARARSDDYRFELVGKPQVAGGKDLVLVRLVHVADGKPVPDAVIFESKADMGPAGMATMPAPVKAMSAQDGIYSFEVEPDMAGIWALHLAAKVQGEPGTVRDTLDIDLAK